MSSIRSEYATATVNLEAEVDYRAISGARTVAYRPEDAVRATADCLRAVNTPKSIELADALEGLVS